jgi:hypothetical protein
MRRTSHHLVSYILSALAHRLPLQISGTSSKPVLTSRTSITLTVNIVQERA